MTFLRTHPSFGTCALLFVVLITTLSLLFPAPASAQQIIPTCSDGSLATRGALGTYNTCPSGATLDGGVRPVVTPTQCDVSLTNLGAIFNPVCWGRVIGSLIGGLLVFAASWFLTIAGVLFNWALNITVVQFGQFMSDTVLQSITSAWTAFRDISNIIIIGMFTFIAISIILGLKEFGQKRLIAHVLIIAVLINFSLLFTKMVIDASNFVGTRFYNATLAQSATGAVNSTTQLGIGNCSTGTANSQCYGVAGAFMDYAGVSSFGDTGQAIRNLADKLDDGFIAFLFAVFTALLFVVTALVLFYGAFLLISRGILFIFLMAVSSLAFASYLVPVWDKSNFGFSAWKDSLLKNALLAPLMIMFLWMTLNVAGAMRASVGGGTLGDLITNPTKDIDISALFNYLVIVGLLFLSFKLSSSLASKIGGFGFVQGGLATALALSSRVTGYGLRKATGYTFGSRVNSLNEEIKKERVRLDTPGIGAGLAQFTRQRIDKLEGQKRRAEWFTKQNYNLAQSKLGDFAAKQTGVSSFLSSGDKKASFAEGTKKAAEAAATRAEAAFNLTGKDQDKVRSQEERRRFRETQRTLGEQVVATERVAQASQQQAQTQGRQLDQQKQIAEQQARAVETGAKANKAVFEEEIRALSQEHGTAPAASQPSIKTQIAEKQQAIDAEDRRIEDAHAEVKELQLRATALRDNAQHDQDALEKAKEKFASLGDPNSQVVRDIKKGAEDVVKAAVENAKKEGASGAERFGTNVVARLAGLKTYGGGKARGAYEEKQTKSQLRKTLDDLIKENTSSGGGTPPPPTGGTPP